MGVKSCGAIVAAAFQGIPSVGAVMFGRSIRMSRSRQSKNARRSPRCAALLALIAGFAATGVSADTLAQPKDNALERQAADYIRFREDVAAIEAMPFKNADITREAHRRFAAHRVPVNSEPPGVNLRLVLEEGERAPRRKGAEEPAVVPR